MNLEGFLSLSGTPEDCTKYSCFTQKPLKASLSVPLAHAAFIPQLPGWPGVRRGGTSHLSPPCCLLSLWDWSVSPAVRGGSELHAFSSPVSGVRWQGSGGPPEPAAPRPQPWGQTLHPPCVSGWSNTQSPASAHLRVRLPSLSLRPAFSCQLCSLPPSL